MTTLGVVLCTLSALFAVSCVFASKQRPNHISNGFLLELAVLFFLGGFTYIAWDNLNSHPWMGMMVGVLFYLRFALFIAIGLALLVNGIVGIRRGGLSLTSMLPFPWGAMLVLAGYWFLAGPGKAMTGSTFYVYVMDFLGMLVGYIPFALFGAWLSNDICRKAHRAPETEYIIALGCGLLDDGTVTPLLRGRLDAALAEYERGGRRAKIITSGGQGPDEVIPEARAMANYLLSQGVPESDILLEDTSTTTEENLINSRTIIDARGGAKHCTIATSSYHCLRAAMFARRLGINANCVGGRTAAFFYPAAFFREYIALIMRNRYAVVIFFAFTVLRFYLDISLILPSALL